MNPSNPIYPVSKHMPDDTHDRFYYYPANCVVGIIDTLEAANSTVKALYALGYQGDAIGVLHGERGIQVLDRSGEEHGWFARVRRQLQSVSEQEGELLTTSENELRAGHYLFKVCTDGNREAMEAVRQVLKAHGGHFIAYYWPLGTELVDE